jgi:pimeloyl-ACP methyl ester carboxylesterase
MAIAEIPLRVWRTRGQSFVFQNHTLRYWTSGQGEPLLLIHGFPSASWDWHYLWRPLAQRFRLIACDMLGFGDSAKPLNHAYSLTEQADIQQALLDHLGVREPVHVMGHGYGVSVCQELLARHAEGRARIASCVFLNGGVFPEAHKPLLMHQLLLSPLGSWVARAFNRDTLFRSVLRLYGPHTGPSESEVDDHWSLIKAGQGNRVLHRLIDYIPERRVQRARWLKAMQQSGVPMRLINGSADPISGASMLARYRQMIAWPDTVALDMIGHYPHTEAPDLVLRHYLSFRQVLRCCATLAGPARIGAIKKAAAEQRPNKTFDKELQINVDEHKAEAVPFKP